LISNEFFSINWWIRKRQKSWLCKFQNQKLFFVCLLPFWTVQSFYPKGVRRSTDYNYSERILYLLIIFLSWRIKVLGYTLIYIKITIKPILTYECFLFWTFGIVLKTLNSNSKDLLSTLSCLQPSNNSHFFNSENCKSPFKSLNKHWNNKRVDIWVALLDFLIIKSLKFILVKSTYDSILSLQGCL
jgi:hypothetical protein